MLDSDEQLSKALKTWKLEAEIPSGFQREVWQRIAVRQQSSWRRLAQGFFELLATPRYATTVLVAAVVIGAGVAQVGASQENARRWDDLQSRYAASIDPVAQAFAR